MGCGLGRRVRIGEVIESICFPFSEKHDRMRGTLRGTVVQSAGDAVLAAFDEMGIRPDTVPA